MTRMPGAVNAFGSVDGRRTTGVNTFGANEVDTFELHTTSAGKPVRQEVLRTRY